MPIPPGATLGMLGSGQLGRMFAMAARRLGYRVHVYSETADSPAGEVSDREFVGAYDDVDAVEAFARTVEVVTFEFENVPSASANRAARFAPVRPGEQVLHVTQNRLREKSFFRNQGLPVADFRAIHSLGELESGLAAFGGTGVLKTAESGYDGKGQRLVQPGDRAADVWPSFAGRALILESLIRFECELSVVGVRAIDGEFMAYGPFLNTHANHILDTTVCPGPFASEILREAIRMTRAVLEGLQVVGVLCVEFFLESSGRLLVNEAAPRPHNSGHLTIEAHESCQFEQQVRAVCGLPLGSAEQRRPAAMANVLGDVWANGEPDWSAALALSGVHLHLYGKREAKPGRKMGHITALDATGEAALARVVEARRRLARLPAP